MNWVERLKQWVVPTPTAATRMPRVEPGLYHYQRAREGGYQRLHLRVDPSGEGLLIASASEIVRLSQAGVIAAKGLLDGASVAEVEAELPVADPAELTATVQDLFEDLGRPSGRYPILNPADPTLSADPAGMLAPFRADLEAGTADEMRRLVTRLWDVGVPHARLIARETFDAESLVLAVERAEDLGVIAGLTADARQLSEGDRLDRLAAVGLDYVVVPWAVTDELQNAIYGPTDADTVANLIRRIHSLEMAPVLEIPLFDETDDVLEENVACLDGWNVRDVEVFAVIEPNDDSAPGEIQDQDEFHAYAAHELAQAAAWVEDLAEEANLRVAWLPPLIRSPRETVAETIRRGGRAGGDATMRIGAAGDVVAPRGPYESAGNLLADEWSTIWYSEAFERIREDAEEVAADPSDPRGWQQPPG